MSIKCKKNKQEIKNVHAHKLKHVLCFTQCTHTKQ